MADIRIYSLAKELGCRSKDLLEILREFGISGKVASSSLVRNDADRVRKHFFKSPKTSVKTPPKTSVKSPAASKPILKRRESPIATPLSSVKPRLKRKEDVVHDQEIKEKKEERASRKINTAPQKIKLPQREQPAVSYPIIVARPNPTSPFARKPSFVSRGAKKRLPSGGGRVKKSRPSASPQNVSTPPSSSKQAVSASKPFASKIQTPSGKPAPASKFKGEPRLVYFTEHASVKALAEKMDVRAKDLMSALLRRGLFVSINQTVDPKVAVEVAEEFGCLAEYLSFEEAEERKHKQKTVKQKGEQGKSLASEKNLIHRAPIVAVMGHVDHGKTKLLDAIRKTHVALDEAGGITQRIGAYRVTATVEGVPKTIVFLDTPGHEAFTRMRSRGASVTDVVILVVAADDGVKPQTEEAISHAKSAGVPIVVAINKTDKPEADVRRVKTQLSEKGLVSEDWGGDTVMVEISALKQTGISSLLEMVLLVSDLKELKADPSVPARGTVLEAKLDPGHGRVANIIIQNGTLRRGDPFIMGGAYGRVRAILDDAGKFIDEAPPSVPVEIFGINGLPEAGDKFQVVDDEKEVRRIASMRQEKSRQEAIERKSRMSLASMSEEIKLGKLKVLSVVLKCDVTGSLEAVSETLQRMSTEKVTLQVVHSAVGAVTEGDVLLAATARAAIVGFHVRSQNKASEVAEREGVDILLFDVIYELTKAVETAMIGLLEPSKKETLLGRAEVRDVFKISGVGAVAGCMVVTGHIARDAQVRLVRQNAVVYDGKIASLKRFKEDAKTVQKGLECGLGIENFNDVKVGDAIEAYSVELVKADSLD